MLNHSPDTADGRLAIRWRGDPDSDRRETVVGQGYFGKGAFGGVGLVEMIKSIVVGGERRILLSDGSDLCDPRKLW
jgi:hypothetical protein